MANFRIVSTLPEADWRGFVERHPSGNIFHTPEMFEVFSRVKGHRPQLWAALDSHGEPLALFTPVEVALAGGPLRLFMARSVAYGGVLCAPGERGQQALAALLRQYQAAAGRADLFTELRHLSSAADCQPALTECGFVYEPHLNFLCDVRRPVDELWKNLHESVRKSVRRARREGAEVETATSAADCVLAYDVLAQVYRHNQVPLAPVGLFKAAFEVLYPKQMIQVWRVVAKGQTIGAGWRLLYKNVVYAWYGGALREQATYKAHELLNWHSLEWAAANDFRLYDFGGAGRPTEAYGPRDFKAKFGGQLVEYGRNTYVPSRLRLQLSQWGYRWARRLFRLAHAAASAA